MTRFFPRAEFIITGLGLGGGAIAKNSKPESVENMLRVVRQVCCPPN